ncbi:ATP-binding protein, partial [Staphylococcus epidermidis]|uniref:ATP-binding protein n=1 Tax=Staphylococcus epidermidis TaxID=1282 RepID=UPI0028CB411C
IYHFFTDTSTPNSLPITYQSYFNQYKLYPPILNLKKTQILPYHYPNQIPYYHDISNQHTKYLTNHITQPIIPPINHNPHLNPHHLLKLNHSHHIQFQSLKQQPQTFINNQLSKTKYLTYSFSTAP